jgi:hypothetical protein
MPILPPTLTTQFGQGLGMSMAKTESTLNGRCATRTASLRLSFTLFLGPVFRAFLRLKLDGGTLRCRGLSLLPQQMRMVWSGRGAVALLLRFGRFMGALKLHGKGV